MKRLNVECACIVLLASNTYSLSKRISAAFPILHGPPVIPSSSLFYSKVMTRTKGLLNFSAIEDSKVCDVLTSSKQREG